MNPVCWFEKKTIPIYVLGLMMVSTIRADEPPQVIEHVMVYREDGRFGGWPANHGIWIWDTEILVGFSRGTYKDLGLERHNIDRELPEEHWFARSLDGGHSWSLEDPSKAIVPWGTALHGVRPPHLIPRVPVACPGGIDFTHPDFAMTLRMLDIDVGPSLFYTSTDRGRNWNGPYDLLVENAEGIAARTDYLVNGPNDCMIFLTASKPNGREGRPLMARTTDGGKNWKFVSWIAPETDGFMIMPASVRLSETHLICAVRRREEAGRWIEVYRSLDNGETWEWLSRPMDDNGEGNPPSLIQLSDGRLCLTYGYRAVPYSIRVQFSDDEGQSWSEPFTLRDDGAGRDIGYVRTVQRPDGNVVTVYYFYDRSAPERYIAATIWDPEGRH